VTSVVYWFFQSLPNILNIMRVEEVRRTEDLETVYISGNRSKM